MQLKSDLDLSGAWIHSDKPVVALSGTVWTSVVSETMGDHLVEQLPPTLTWGREYYVLPIATRNSGDLVRIFGKFKRCVNEQLL